MRPIIKNAIQPLTEFYIKEDHLKPLEKLSDYFEEINCSHQIEFIRKGFIELLKYEGYKDDRDNVRRVIMVLCDEKWDDVMEVNLTLRWREMPEEERGLIERILQDESIDSVWENEEEGVTQLV